ncbi:MAG: hypothetical protein DRP52_04310, partial [Planctomycetota bacterium]
MLSGKKLTQVCKERKISDGQLAEHLAHGGMSTEDALGVVRNWKKELYIPAPGKEDVERLVSALGVET